MNKKLEKIILTYGVQPQMDMAIEEMSELTKALLKYRRKKATNAEDMQIWIDDISEEMADVVIMLEQLKIIFNNEKEVKEQIAYKIDRTMKRIEKEGKHE